MTGIIEIQNLRTYFNTDNGVVKAVDDLSLTIMPGHTLGVVGESGSGKSVTSLTIMKLLAATAEINTGSVMFLGQDIVHMSEKQMRKLRGSEISMIFQEPMSSLNPVHKVGHQVMEAILEHQDVTKDEARARTIELFVEVGIPDPAERIHYYPHQMSGGQKQRVMIAMALSCNPKLLIADEPTTALDVTVQKQILDLIRELRDKRQMAVLFITHDLGVIAEIADDVMVMYRGKVVEQGNVLDIYENPMHPYTHGLIGSVPSRNKRGVPLAQIPGMTPSLLNLPTGCAFGSRCPKVGDACSVIPEVSAPEPGRELRCHYPILGDAA